MVDLNARRLSTVLHIYLAGHLPWRSPYGFNESSMNIEIAFVSAKTRLISRSFQVPIT